MIFKISLLVFGNSADRLVVGMMRMQQRNGIEMFQYTTGHRLKSFGQHIVDGLGVRFSPNGSRIVVCDSGAFMLV